MPSSDIPVTITDIGNVISELRGQRVILDTDLAAIYGVPTKALNQAVKRNRGKFPEDFIFQVTREEVEQHRRLRSRFVTLNTNSNRSQTVTGSQKHRDPRFLPYAFTEHGAIMAATILNSPRAVQMSVFVVRAFVKMRSMLTAQKDLAKRLADLERKLTERLDLHELAISDIIQQILQLLNPPAEPEPPRRAIGFHVKERRSAYRVRKGARKGVE